ncbi:MAG: methyl-accepting chemotaxis protein [Oscillospiraceae bacterium]|nr:methyl-accepting chemotaxis protein [Oscillospiraceae bacterium]
MKRLSLATKITAFYLLTLIIYSAITGVFAFIIQRDGAITESGKRTLSVAQTVAVALDGDEYKSIMSSGEVNDYYLSYKKIADNAFEKSGAVYLYVLDRNYGSEVTYFAEGYGEGSRDEEYLLGDSESASSFDPALFETLEDGQDRLTDVYDLGGFGRMISGFSPVFDSSGKVVAVVGVDLPVDEALKASSQFAVYLLIFVAVSCLVFAVIVAAFIKRLVGRPVGKLVEAADRLAVGDISVSVEQKRSDEIGRLEKAFARMVAHSDKQAQLLTLLAEGDLTIEAIPQSSADRIGNAMADMTGRLNELFIGVKTGISEVASGSRQIRDGAQLVASGATSQASAVESLSVTIGELTESTRQNLRMADETASLSGEVRGDAEKGSAQMEDMLRAVQDINDESKNIGKVIKVIDDLAFQTNVLALNAAVEAARAGQYGRGFAVVAEEVRNLAAKSAEAAKDTEKLINASMAKADSGARLAEETSKSLRGIVEGINKSAALADEIAKMSDRQSAMIDDINRGVAQVSAVIAQNGATAEESAAGSQQMSEQADILEKLTARFKLKEERAGSETYAD